MGAAARPLGDGGCPWITGHNRTKTGHGRNLALHSSWSGSAAFAKARSRRAGLLASFGQNAPRRPFFQRIAATRRATKKPAAVSRPGVMRSFRECSFLEDSRYASQVIFVTRSRAQQIELVSRRKRRGGKATGGGNPRPDARPRIDRYRFRP